MLRTTLDPTMPIGAGRDRDSRYRLLADHHVEAVLHDLGIRHDVLRGDQHDRQLEKAAEFALARLHELGEAPSVS